MENENPSIGTRTEHTVNYIDRTRLSAKCETQPASSRNILQEMQDSRPHLHEKLEKEVSKVWKPSKLLQGDGRIILVTNEPGMGKTLLTHLVQKTREIRPDISIVRVNINKYTRILRELQTKGCDEKGVIKLLTEAAQIK